MYVISTGGPKDMRPWETKSDYNMRKHGVNDVQLAYAREARERGDYQLAKKITMSL